MKARRQLLGILAGILCLIALAMWFPWFKPWIDLKALERQAKRNLDATELQQWAMNMIAKHPSETTSFAQCYGTNYYSSTNFPSGLRKIDLFSHGLNILTNKRDVAIFGMGKGGPFLQVGAPSLAAPTNQTFIQWKPGIFVVGG